MNAADVPKYVFKSQAWSLLPVIQKYYESEDGKRHWSGVTEKGRLWSLPRSLSKKSGQYIRCCRLIVTSEEEPKEAMGKIAFKKQADTKTG